MAVVLVSPNCADLGVKGNIFETKQFPDGENYVRVPVPVKGERVVVLHRCWPKPDECLMQLFLLSSQLKEMGAENITAVIPYFPYARQDKRFLEGEAISSELICRMLKQLGVDQVVVFDCHFLKKAGTFQQSSLTIHNVSMAEAVLSEARKLVKNPVIMSPDEGANYMVSGSGGVSMKKTRGDFESGEHAYRKIDKLEMKADVKGRDVVLVDDMISTGSTMIKAVSTLKEAGASKIVCAATHGLFLKDSLNRLLQAGVLDVITSDSIQNQKHCVGVKKFLKPWLGE